MNDVKERAERTRLETQVVEAKKMEQLVSSVAHEFNNMLTVIISYNDLIMSEISPESPLRAYSEEIQDASKRSRRFGAATARCRSQTNKRRFGEIDRNLQTLDSELFSSARKV